MLRTILALVLSAACLHACGGKSPCEQLCEELKPKIEDQLPQIFVDCSDSAWGAANNCQECKEVLADKYDVAMTDSEEICIRFFGSE
jgi:hypothetical protein